MSPRAPRAAIDPLASEAVPRARFVGREQERGLLSAELRMALAGEGRLVALVGEPGIGKTTTAAALAAEARTRGAAVAWGRCHERDRAPVYWPVVQALSSLVDGTSGEARAQLASALAGLRVLDAARAAELPPARARFELFERVATALCAAARGRPLVLAFDDLHWADVGSLRMLEFLVREAGSSPLLVLCTLREDALRSPVEEAVALAALVRLGRSVQLAGLARAPVEALLAERLGFAPHSAVVERVLAATDGNPFLVLELAELFAARGDGPGEADMLGAIPPGAQELLRQRLAPLGAGARRVLELAAVLGRRFELGPLARALGQEPNALLDTLAEPLALGLVRPVTGSLRAYEFAHALLREALYAGLSPAARGALHGAIGGALEAETSSDDERLPALAHHFFQASQVGDPRKAQLYGCEAGERALRLLAFEESVQHFERALAALALLEDDALRLRVLVGLGEALRGAGDASRSDALFGEAIDLARQRGAEDFTTTVLRFSLVRAELSLLDAELNALLEEALEVAPPGDNALRARLEARLAAGLHLLPGAERRRRELSDEALQTARGLGDPALVRFVLSRRLTILLGPDDLAERLATTDEILHGERTSRGAALEALMFRIDDLAERGDRAALDHALAVFEQGTRASREPFFRWTAASLRAAMAVLEGRFAEAEGFASEAFALGRGVQARTAGLRFAQQLCSLRGWQGRLAEVEALVGGGVSETQIVPAWRCALASLYSFVGREAEARREFEALAASDFAAVPRDANWLISMAQLATVCAQLRETARAARLYQLLEPYAARIAVSRLAVMLGPIEHSLGMLASLRGEFALAEAHFARALAVAERMRALPWQADTRFQWAAMLVQRGGPGDLERSRELLAECEGIAEAVGMEIMKGWIDELRQRGPAAHGAHAESGGRSAALRREGSVWTLVFEGRTTRLRAMVGLEHIARLLAEPGRELAALDLIAAAYARRREPGSARRAPSDAGELLDARARADYVTRLRDARKELEEAARQNDRGRCERLGEEIEFLTRELSRAFGLTGRRRLAGSDAERARLSVSRAIRYAIQRLGEHDPDLAEHLRRGIRTGTTCSYTPSSRDPVSWTS